MEVSEEAGRRFAVDCHGTAELVEVGLHWRSEVCAQVFEEAAVDLGRALGAFARAKGTSKRIGFPRFVKKGHGTASFRLRNKVSMTGRPSIRVGDTGPRSITLPVIGAVRVIQDTRRLRRLLRSDRGRICSVTVKAHRGRFVILVIVEAAELHPAMLHPSSDHGFVGVDRGLSSYLVAARADGTEVARVEGLAPLARALPSLRRACRRQSRTQPQSKNRRKANARVALIYAKVADQRHDFLHRVSSTLVKTHDHLCLEDLAVGNLMQNRHLSRRIADATWGRFAQMVTYKSAWYGTELLTAPRFFPSTKSCSSCGWVWAEMGLGHRIFVCQACGMVLDRDRNAASNLAAWANAESAWASQAPDPEARGRVTNACGGNGAGRCSSGGATGPAIDRSHPARKQEPAHSTG